MATQSAERVDIIVNVGANFREEYTYTDGVGSVVDLTGWTGTSQIRRRPTSSSPVIASPTVTLTDAEAGEFTVTLDDSVTDALEPNDEGEHYFWQLDFSDGSDTVRVIEGWCTVRPSVIH